MDKQLIVIMGPGRTGKSTLAKIVGSEMGAMWFSTDSLVWMLHRAAPQLGVPNNGFDPEEKSAGIEPYLVAFLENTTYNHGLTIVEGDAISPRQLERLDEQFGVAAAVCLVNTSPSAADLVVGGGWMSHLDDDELVTATKWIANYSAAMQVFAAAEGVPCFDVTGLVGDARFEAPRASLLEQMDRRPG